MLATLLPYLRKRSVLKAAKVPNVIRRTHHRKARAKFISLASMLKLLKSGRTCNYWYRLQDAAYPVAITNLRNRDFQGRGGKVEEGPRVESVDIWPDHPGLVRSHQVALME